MVKVVRKKAPVAEEKLQQRKIPAQRRAEATLKHLLATSAQLLEEVGIDGFNTNLLAERAELRVATIYRYFPNKLSILCALVQQLTDRLKESIMPIGDLSDPARDWREVINSVIDSYIATGRSQPGFTAIRRALLAVPELRAIERSLVQEISALIVTAMKKRGIQASDPQLSIVASIFLMAGSTIYDYAWIKGKKDKVQESLTLDEMRLMLTSYLANYLD
jgi:AcrR family transcriptional regulator